MSDIPMTPAQAAEIAGVNPETIRRAILRGKLKGGRIGRYYGVTIAALCDWIQDGRQAGRRPRNIATCELCRLRPTAVHLTFRRMDKYACWPCFQQVVLTR